MLHQGLPQDLVLVCRESGQQLPYQGLGLRLLEPKNVQEMARRLLGAPTRQSAQELGQRPAHETSAWERGRCQETEDGGQILKPRVRGRCGQG